MKIFISIASVALAILLNGCSGNSKTTPQPTSSASEFKTPCPLVTDADLAKLNPEMKRAGDEWEKHNDSILCIIHFGVSMESRLYSANATPKPFEDLVVAVRRTADIRVDRRLPRDRCTHRGYAHIGECVPLRGVGDYAFYEKTLGPPKVYKFDRLRYQEFAKEGVRCVSGPYEIEVLADSWKGGDPRQGIIELARKLAADYH